MAVEGLVVESFVDPTNRMIFGAMLGLVEGGYGTDSPAVIAELQARSLFEAVGGAATLVELQNECATREPSAIDGWIERISDAHARRRLMEAGPEIIGIATSGMAADAALEQAEALVTRISSPTANQAVPLTALLIEQTAHIEAVRTGQIELGTTTGLAALDRLIGGLAPQRFYVLGGRPSMGKTSAAYEIALATALTAGLPVLIATLEMPASEVTARLTAAHAYVDYTKLTEGALIPEEQVRYERSLEILATAPIEVLDDSLMTVPTIRAAARRLKSKYGALGLVVVDYLQLLTAHAHASSRQEQVALISRTLKIMSRQLDAPVLAVSQLSRKLEERTDKRPILADLRESGAIEQDADVIIFVYRDEVYNPLSEDRGKAEMIVPKNRQGKAGVAVVAWAGPCMTFFDLPAQAEATSSSGPAPAVAATLPGDEF